jgi:F-type H+-transporting ATPase subunit delta
MANIAARYSKALFDFGIKQSPEAVARFASLLDGFASNWSSSLRLRQVLLSPSNGKSKKKQFLSDVFPSVDDKAFLSFLCVLVDKDRISIMDKIHAEYTRMYLDSLNSRKALIESAYPLDDATVEKITEVFRKKTGLRKLISTVQVNEELLGGIRVTIGSETYDGTTRSELDRLFETMTI